MGSDCATNESFGFDTIKMKENNLRLKFEDTSTTASFPSTDWELTANDSANGGQNRFSIRDVTANRVVFTVEGNAPTNALYVDDGGRLGLGTAIPTTDVHVVSGNTPTVRLEQNGSSGFAPQTWDMAGNETNYFIRDVTNGSTLPLRIRPGAPTSAIDIDDDGNVGIGTDNPGSPLDVVRNTGTAAGLLTLTNNSTVFLSLEDTSSETWNVQSNSGELRFTNATGAGIEMRMTTGGDMTITGQLTTAGSCSVGCDAVFTDDYEILPIAERAELMWANGYLPNVGPTAEDGPFNVSDKMGRMLNELEHAHIYIAQLHSDMEAMKTNHQAEMAALASRLNTLEDGRD